MALDSPHKHLGFNIQMDGLIQRGNLVINPEDWALLHQNTTHSFVKLHDPNASDEKYKQAQESTELNATQIGPLSGPEQGSGPLVPVGSLEAPAVVVPTTESKQFPTEDPELVSAEPAQQPYPVDPVLGNATEAVNPEPEHEQTVDEFREEHKEHA